MAGITTTNGHYLDTRWGRNRIVKPTTLSDGFKSEPEKASDAREYYRTRFQQMRKNLFLTTIDNRRDYQKTVMEPADLSEWSNRPSNFPEQARAWGIRKADQNRQAFDKMRQGDYVLLYENGTNEYAGAGIIDATCETEWLVDQYWDNPARTLVFTLSEYHDVSVPLKEVNEVLEYKSAYHPQAVVRVSDRRPLSEALELFNF